MMATLRASPVAGAPIGIEPSFLGRIGLSLLELAPGDGEEESRRFGMIRMAEAELGQARAGRKLHVQVAALDGRGPEASATVEAIVTVVAHCAAAEAPELEIQVLRRQHGI